VDEGCRFGIDFLADRENRSVGAAVDESERRRWLRKQFAMQRLDCRGTDSSREIFVHHVPHVLGEIKEAERSVRHS
jgi:hypothetical protein